MRPKPALDGVRGRDQLVPRGGRHQRGRRGAGRGGARAGRSLAGVPVPAAMGGHHRRSHRRIERRGVHLNHRARAHLGVGHHTGVGYGVACRPEHLLGRQATRHAVLNRHAAVHPVLQLRRHGHAPHHERHRATKERRLHRHRSEAARHRLQLGGLPRGHESGRPRVEGALVGVVVKVGGGSCPTFLIQRRATGDLDAAEPTAAAARPAATPGAATTFVAPVPPCPARLGGVAA
mmetsp:Transcript_35135/g.111855  ORF Transcript_35135/g.111855 Transcript_35135/m.111855 type:complete len:234 (-) Transcript_35135:372-1073(-)